MPHLIQGNGVLQGLEGFCTTVSSLERFRGSEAVRAFIRRWNLPVYFSLRFQEIAGNVLHALFIIVQLDHTHPARSSAIEL